MADIKVTVRPENGCHIVTVTGEVDASNVKLLQNAMPDIEKEALLVLDFTNVSYMGSEGLNLLVKWRLKSGFVVLAVAASERVKRMLEITEIGKFFPVYDTLDKALKAASKLCQIKSEA